jgi:Cu/Ag efflux protein CusF
MRTVQGAVVATVFALQVSAVGAEAPKIAQAPAGKPPASSSAPAPGKAGVATVTVHGTISAIDKEARTITLKGPKRTLTLDVQDPSKLDAVKVGDPVVARYMEAIAVQVRKAGTATPGASVQESRVSSKPGENPAGAIAREVTVTATVTAINTKAQTVTIKGPRGHEETIKVRDPENLKAVKKGDLVEITYIQALAVALDRKEKPAPAKK